MSLKCTYGGRSTATTGGFKRPVDVDLLLEQHLVVLRLDGMLGFFRGPILDQRIAFNETGLPVEVQVKLLNLAIVSESIIDIVFLGLFMDVRYDNDPSLNSCDANGEISLRITEARDVQGNGAPAADDLPATDSN